MNPARTRTRLSSFHLYKKADNVMADKFFDTSGGIVTGSVLCAACNTLSVISGCFCSKVSLSSRAYS